MFGILSEKFVRYFLCSSLFALSSCSKVDSLQTNQANLDKNGSSKPSTAASVESWPEEIDLKTEGFALTGPNLREVPLAAVGSPDNGTLAVVHLLVKNPATGAWWLNRYGTGLYAGGVFITAAHVVEGLKTMIPSYNQQGLWAKPYIGLPKLPGFETKLFMSSYGATPYRPLCRTANIQFWNDVGVLYFQNRNGRRLVEAKIAELAGLPAGTTRNPPLNFSNQLTTGTIPASATFYGIKNNGTYEPRRIWSSASNTAIKSSACSMGGPCYYVFTGTGSDYGDSGGPLWMPGSGWIGLVAGSGPRPTSIYNTIVGTGCGDTGTVSFNNDVMTTYFAKFSANSSFFQTILANATRSGFWSDLVNRVYPDITGYYFDNNIPINQSEIIEFP